MATCRVVQQLGQASQVACSSGVTSSSYSKSDSIPQKLHSRSAQKVLHGSSTYLGTKVDIQIRAVERPRSCRTRQFTVQAAKKVSSDRSLLLVSTLEAEEGKEQEVIALCKGIVAWMREHKLSEKKSGVKDFSCSQDAYDNNIYHFWERYDNMLTMNETRSLEVHTKFMTEVRPLLKQPVALAAYEYKNGQIGHMMNPIGPKGEGGLDDATGQGGGGGGAGYQQHAKVELGNVNRDAWGMDKMVKSMDLGAVQRNLEKVFKFGKK